MTRPLSLQESSLSSIRPLQSVEGDLEETRTSQWLMEAVNHQLAEGAKHGYDKAYTASQITALLEANPQLAKEIGMTPDFGTVRKDIVGPYHRLALNAQANNNHVYFLGVGSSAFIGEMDGSQNPRGYGSTANLIGIAYEAATGEFKLYKSFGQAEPNDRVAGINVGFGISGGLMKGTWEDFFGDAVEKTGTVVVGYSEIHSTTGAEGRAYSFGKGIGYSSTEIMTRTEEVKWRK